MKRVVIYVRLSVTKEESVSIDRQIEAARTYAEQRHWEVVGMFCDDGVSASKSKPEERKGWSELMAFDEPWDAVIIWKIDRMVRRIAHFWDTYTWLDSRGKSLVSVMDTLDMTTPIGRIVAGILAGFAEMEADGIAARVKDARTYLVSNGRVVGGTIPYGWRSVANPDGPGLVLAQDPERVAYVQTMVEMVLTGSTVYAVQQWATANAPLPQTSQVTRKTSGWAYSTVERLLRHPILAGMTPFNPGNETKQRGDDVRRDETGLPVVDDAVAIITTEQRRTLLATLDARNTPQTRPRASKARTSPLLSRLVTCAHCGTTMHRRTAQGRPCLSCPGCHQTASHLDRYVAERLLAERGDRPIFVFENVPHQDTGLADIEEAIHATALKMTQDGADVLALSQRLSNLKDERTRARRTPTRSIYRMTGRTVSEAWDAATDDLERRSILASEAARILLRKGRTGRYFDQSRLTIEWRDRGLHLPDGSIADASNGTWVARDDGIYYSPKRAQQA